MSEVATPSWDARNAWAGCAKPGRSGLRTGAAGVTIETLDRALATIVCGAADQATLAGRLQEHFGLDLPGPGRAGFARDHAIVWSAPAQWLVVGPRRGALDELPGVLAGLAAVTDQTDSRALVRLRGPDVRDMLAKGFAIDLHPAVMADGDAAVTKAAHLSVQIWREDDSYTIAVGRSFAGSFWAWLLAASAAYGCDVLTFA